jgi:hypothetical protein
MKTAKLLLLTAYSHSEKPVRIINKGFVIEERNAKLPFAVLFRKGKKVNYKFNLSLSY